MQFKLAIRPIERKLTLLVLLLIFSFCKTEDSNKEKLRLSGIFYIVNSFATTSSVPASNSCNIQKESSYSETKPIAPKIFAHALFASNSDVPPRGEDMKIAPCGVNQRTNNAVTLKANSQITIRWKETVNHPGFYWIEFSKENDTNWSRLKTIADTQNNTNDLPHFYEADITVPDLNCDKCTIRIVQEMTENPQSPSYYYSCGDIKIIGGKC